MLTVGFEPAIPAIQLSQTARPEELNVIRHTFYGRPTVTEKRRSVDA